MSMSLLKKLRGCSEYGVRLLNAARGLPHEIADGRLKRQTSTQRAEKLPTTAVASQDFTFRDWKGRMPVLKLLHGIGQGEFERQGLDGTSHDIGNGEGPYRRMSGHHRCEPCVGRPREQRKLQVFLQQAKRLSQAGEIRAIDNDQVQGRFRLDRRWVCRVVRAFKKRHLPEMVSLCPRDKRSACSFVHVKPGAASLNHKDASALVHLCEKQSRQRRSGPA